ncbi:MAG TPA: hypothetical protein VL400_19570 [Polyangiaceae bacterium]|nr:hypothetical protein [Polyangiaceae bacterium]
MADAAAATPDTTTPAETEPEAGTEFSSKTSMLISAWEHAGGDPTKVRSRYNPLPHWPGGASGLTIGMGYDLRYQSPAQLHSDWDGVLTPEQLARLEAYTTQVKIVKGKQRKVVGPKPTKAALKAMADIEVRYKEGLKVFEDKILPRYREDAYRTFPGLKDMDPYTQASVIAMTYNRGTGYDDDPNRKRGESKAKQRKRLARAKHFVEMKGAIFRQDTVAISAILREMKAETSMKGVKNRREGEAKYLDDHRYAADAWSLFHDKYPLPSASP